ncbi:hypothetical protein Leryth_014443 [Lithospermum erythrorhizon]|nr:hypothetical protein Leryth_014443 [Lithospermum erythrorhizon]
MRRLIQRPASVCPNNLKSSITFLFTTMLLVYVLYSFKIIFNKDQSVNVDISSKQSLDTSTNNNSSFAPPPPSCTNDERFDRLPGADTTIKHIVFGIAGSADLWDDRKEYIKQWWKPGETRGVVWLESNVTTSEKEGLPETRISGNTSDFAYTNPEGRRAALRLSRVVSETFRIGMNGVRWFVMGDDDTVFIVENVVRVLSKYDHNQFYYIGGISESHIQNIHFSYAMAFGGGGFAISYPLAKELEKIQDKCIQRYPGLYGSDDRIQACMAELGVPLTRELGFHQFDIYGNLLGLLGSHPVAPLVTLHHLDVIDPIFPYMSRVDSIRNLLESARYDSASLIQQSVCYDQRRFWSISVSWGYAVQITRGIISPRELERPARTFLNWYKGADLTAYTFNSRNPIRKPCQKPYVFYMSTTRYDRYANQVMGIYQPYNESHPVCHWKTTSPETIDSVVVLKTPDKNRWKKSPRRDCCRIIPARRRGSLKIWVKNCDEGEYSGL